MGIIKRRAIISVILIFAALVRLIPASIAKSKGRSFGAWWVYGTLLFIIAIIHAIVLQPTEESRLETGDISRLSVFGVHWGNETKCGRRGRMLTVPGSIASGFGPECIGLV